MSGLAGVLLRKDFIEAVETLKRISGIDHMFSLSLHELTACIYYKLAIDRGLRGCDPEGELRCIYIYIYIYIYICIYIYDVHM
jgi:hypothetical protein